MERFIISDAELSASGTTVLVIGIIP